MGFGYVIHNIWIWILARRIGLLSGNLLQAQQISQILQIAWHKRV